MALDLFANYERTENSSLFYRVTSLAPYTITFRLSDLIATNQDLDSVYFCQSSLNNGPFSQFVGDLGGRFQTSINVNCTTPCVCSFSVQVSSLPNNNFLRNFQISAVFVSQIPQANFILYPHSIVYYDEPTNSTKKKLLNSTNYFESSGTWFYGEGHTETFTLSSSTSNSSSLTSNWFIGNFPNQLNGPSKPSSFFQAYSTSNSTVTANIFSDSATYALYPISLLLNTNQIKSDCPVITYQDNGTKSFYPFFNSTISVSSFPDPSNNNLKNNLEVKIYPSSSQLLFENPFPYDYLELPFNFNNKTFISIMKDNLEERNVTKQQFVGSQWIIGASTPTSQWGGVDDEFTNTGFLSTIVAYQFDLGYDNLDNNILDYFKASPTEFTTITLEGYGHKTVVIDLEPFDWIQRTAIQSFNTRAIINPITFTKLYTSNYYNLKNTPIEFTLLSFPEYPYELIQLEITSPKSPETLILNQDNNFKGSISFNETGLINLNLKATIRNFETGSNETVEFLSESIIETLNVYDDVFPDFYQTALTDIELPINKEPLISPNEWVVEDNINKVISDIYNTIDVFERYTKLYTNKSIFTNWLGLEPSTAYVWEDIECTPEEEQGLIWGNHECVVLESGLPLIFPGEEFKAWFYHECGITIDDPNCLGKYCIEWKWSSRKSTNSDLIVSWNDVKCSGRLAKRWRFERCEVEGSKLNCPRDTWKNNKADLKFFPIPSCSSKNRCRFVDINYSELTNQMIVAYKTELHLLNTEYEALTLARRGELDELFAFQDIAGISTNDIGEVFVLDRTLSRVSVFKIQNDNFVLFTTWGKFGLQGNPSGLNKPNDVFVDKNNIIWVTDTGNECLKKFTINGKNIGTIINERFENNPPLSVCLDSQDNAHVLLFDRVVVLNYIGEFLFEYLLPAKIASPKKIESNYNEESIYITYSRGVVKYFRTGRIAYYIIDEYECNTGEVLTGYLSTIQDKYRNLYVTVGDKILKFGDIMKIIETKAPIPEDLQWDLNELLIHKEEYVQPWVYLKSFHRLWDNIELLRNSLFYEIKGCKSYKAPTYNKDDLVIGQNEIVSNAVINRLSKQLWTNLQSLINYFNPECKN